ncbi:MAG: A/G-specific adenine glycosylase [Flavobacteriales bacterium]|nr:A/G-specific adenine glycosylase [Flavobacteriales bacterium]
MKARSSYDLLSWYEKEHRELPWRKTKEPYMIWLSEIIMQQTRVDQGMSYYFKFLELFPTVHDLAKAKESEVLNAWQGLGYYSRGRNLHHSAKRIVEEFDGMFPDNYNSLLSLKGVGPYTAAAISSICFNEQRAVVDGNVERFISRRFGVKEAVNESKGKKIIAEYANEMIPSDRPGDHNQAMMEMGATVCTPKKPKCGECIFNGNCFALKNDLINELPLKTKKTKVKDRNINYLVCQFQDELLMQERREKDIWLGLHDFPNSLSNKKEYDRQLGKQNYAFVGEAVRMIHILSHQKLNVSFQKVMIDEKSKVQIDGIWQDPKGIESTPIPRLIEKYLVENHTDLVDQKI